MTSWPSASPRVARRHPAMPQHGEPARRPAPLAQPPTATRLTNTPPDRATVVSPWSARTSSASVATSPRPAPGGTGRAMTAGRHAGQHVVHDRRPAPAPDRHRSLAGCRPRTRTLPSRSIRRGQALKLDRGLRLVPDPVADPGQRGHRVEQPAHAGGRRAGQMPVSSWRLEHARSSGRGAGGDARQPPIPRQPGGAQVRQRHPARVAYARRRRRAAGRTRGARYRSKPS